MRNVNGDDNHMKQKKIIILSMGLSLLLISTSVLAINSTNNLEQDEIRKSSELIKDSNPLVMNAYAQISIYLYEGIGCGCVPIRDATIDAVGIDVDHWVINTTNDDGLCVLELEYDANYQITIDVPDFNMVLFDIQIVDDQSLTFHLQEKEDVAVEQTTVKSIISTFIQTLTTKLRSVTNLNT